MKRLQAIISAASLLAVAAWTAACGGAPPKPSPTPAASRAPVTLAPSPSPTPKLHTYTEVLKTFPPTTKMCRTVVYLKEVQSSNIMVLSVSPKGEDPFQRGAKDPTIRCVGTQISVTQDVRLENKRYKRGARLTVDKSNNWVEVSSWQ
jgi:hypothetical protein